MSRTSYSGAEMKEMVESFVAETRAMLESLMPDLSAMKCGAAEPDLNNRIFRSLHTIKGTASFMDFPEIIQIAHAAEGLLQKLNRQEIEVSQEIIDMLYEVHYWIGEFVDNPGIRDLNQVEFLKTLRNLHILAGSESENENLLKDTTPDTETHVSELSAEELLKIEEAFAEVNRNLKKKPIPDTINVSQGKSLFARSENIEKLFQNVPGIVNNLEVVLKKQIHLVIDGENFAVNSAIIEQMAAPLLHLLRNACDHGIELPDDREAHAKPRYGTITIDSFKKDNNCVIIVKDDGAGLDPELLANSAVRKQLITKQEVSGLSEAEIFQLIFLPGLSTTDEVSNVSGRGVGMDVVKTNIQKLNGTIEIASERGKGTVFTITLPLS